MAVKCYAHSLNVELAENRLGAMNPLRRDLAIKIGLFVMSCRNCGFCTFLSHTKEVKKTDDGGANFKYMYIWKVGCTKNGDFTDRVEGTSSFCKVPTCSLWRDE